MERTEVVTAKRGLVEPRPRGNGAAADEVVRRQPEP